MKPLGILLNYCLSLKTQFIPGLGLVLFLLSLTACQTARIDLPDGFALWQNDSNSWHAVSANAIRLRVRTTENKPVGTLAVLTNTTELHFKTIGYTILRNEAVQSDAGLKGRLFVTSVQTMNGDYRYLTAFYIDQDKIHIVEAGGRKDDFLNHEQELIRRIKSLQTGY